MPQSKLERYSRLPLSAYRTGATIHVQAAGVFVQMSGVCDRQGRTGRGQLNAVASGRLLHLVL